MGYGHTGEKIHKNTNLHKYTITQKNIFIIYTPENKLILVTIRFGEPTAPLLLAPTDGGPQRAFRPP